MSSDSVSRPRENTGMPLDVPFLPDAGYLSYLNSRAGRIRFLHVALFLPQVPDARPATLELEPGHLAELLALCPGPTKYGLVNSRFHAPESYANQQFLAPLLTALDTLLQAGQLQGIVYSDHYLLQALSDASPEICGQLEAVPSVNCMLDTLPKALWHLDYIAGTRFRSPTKLNLDRGLNRRLSALEKIGTALRERLPGIKLTLLANEGCLPHCPYKSAHDAHMALARLQGLDAAHMAVHRLTGCTRLFAQRPELFFAAPFIRPEDQSAYARVADVLKICGRSRGAATMGAIVRAYVEERFAGNLLWLNDTQECLSHVFHVANEELPHDFLSRVGECDMDCQACGACKNLARQHVQRLAPTLEPMASNAE